MKIPLHVKEVTPSFINPFNGHLLGIHSVTSPVSPCLKPTLCLSVGLFVLFQVLHNGRRSDHSTSSCDIPSAWTSLLPIFHRANAFAFWFNDLFSKEAV